MKFLLLVVAVASIFTARASVESIPRDQAHVSPSEVKRTKSCFAEITRQGCVDPAVDHVHFRICLHDNFSTLSFSCKKLLSDLYSSK